MAECERERGSLIPFVSTPEPTANQEKSANDTDVQRELRFAVVMYGGVSLAIYINGVTQELLHLVRATARDRRGNKMLFPEDQLSATEVVYRKIARQLDEQSGLQPTIRADDVTRTRFVVDIISGTSAGGINGVFLAKALTRNQTMDGLKNLWLSEGDLGKLLNDKKAQDYSRDLGFAVQKPEKSLLNSQRMYRKLLEALEQMGASSSSNDESALVTELDLFVTTTDIEGLPLPIKLSAGVVYERRYRNVFHFRYAPRPIDKPDQQLSRDDFRKEDDPFLAFAARCTSSFPFAFDAMQLNDTRAILDRYRRYERDDPTESNDPKVCSAWDDFFKDYLRLGLFDIDKQSRGETPTGLSGRTGDEATTELRKAFRSRSFGDGGYLDNKPFSYATSMLTRRHADCAVDRKLLYVEPTPEHPELAPKQPGPRPDFAENVRAAVLDLPRQETIREDIDHLYERNRVLERVGTFAQNVDEDIILLTEQRAALLHEDFGAAYLGELINIYGVNYGAYHRLKVDEITNLLAEILARALGHDPDSDATAAICRLVIKWRRQTYSELKTKGVPFSENQFLLDFDIRYSLRRLGFLNRRINQLVQGEISQLESKAKKLLSAWLRHLERPDPDDKPANKNLVRTIKLLLSKIDKTSSSQGLSTEWITSFREELIAIKRSKLSGTLAAARLAEEVFLLSGSEPASRLRQNAANFNFPWETMQQILSAKDEKARDKIVDREFRRREDKLQNLTEVIKTVLSKREGARLTIASSDDVDLSDGAVAARVFLDYYYRNFVLYDLVTYPVQYGTGAGESNIVQVYRVSPEDASALMEERAGGPRDKLAGRTLMSFGAFLDEGWRRNDMLWGRLDGVERLITITLPESTSDADREKFIEEAHLGILREEIRQGNGDAVCQLLSNARAHPHRAARDDKYVEKITNDLLNDPALSAYLTNTQRNYLQVPQTLDRHLEAETALKYISRSTNITGNMLSGLADKYQSDPGKRAGSWVARLGTVFWGMVAAAVPQSLANLLVRHWLGLIYLLSFVTIVLGIVLPGTPIKEVGWASLGIAAAFNLVLFLFGDFIAGRRGWIRALGGLVVIVLAALIGLGVKFVADFVADQDNWPHFGISNQDVVNRVVPGIVAGLIALVFIIKAWIKGLKNFLVAPHAGFSMRRLFWLSLATAVIALWLKHIGPAEIVNFELAGDSKNAQSFVDQADNSRQQLIIDYFFIVAYVAMLASYCVASTKLSWQWLTNLEQKQREKEVSKSRSLARISRFVVIAGFSLAGLQCLAGLLDAGENTGLLWYLNDPSRQTGLTISLYCASLKFALIGLGAFYAIPGFVIGAFQGYKPGPANWKEYLYQLRRSALLLVFAAISGFYLWFSFHALWNRPSLLEDLLGKLFAV